METNILTSSHAPDEFLGASSVLVFIVYMWTCYDKTSIRLDPYSCGKHAKYIRLRYNALIDRLTRTHGEDRGTSEQEEMKFVSWNIRHGGTKKKLEAICNQLKIWNPDVVGLSEFRESSTSQAIAESLREMGLIHQLTTVDSPERGRNFLLLASRYPAEAQPANGILASSGRWLHAKIEAMDVMLTHVPNRSAEKWQFHDEVVAQRALDRKLTSELKKFKTRINALSQ